MPSTILLVDAVTELAWPPRVVSCTACWQLRERSLLPLA